jgi:glycosyltransferase involved in cell wall biosynthesis
MRVSLIIPALNEAQCIGPLLAEIPPDLVHQVIVVDNGSVDGTGEVARSAGARVIWEPRHGYGYACAAGAAAADGDVLAFMDGDGSFIPSDLVGLTQPLQYDRADLVLGSRFLQGLLPGVMPPHQRFGNRLVSWLLGGLYGIQLTDLGPFRVIRRDLFTSLDMREFTYGWTVEMMVKVARRRMRIVEVPVAYRPRLAGKSKVGGTLRGTVLATFNIFRVIFRYGF